MLQLGSILMTVLLTITIVVDCCLPAVHQGTCQESAYIDAVECPSIHDWVAETNSPFVIDSSIEYQRIDLPRAVFIAVPGSPPGVNLVPRTTNDLYLRTGALLI
jgi:hypothetical protein